MGAGFFWGGGGAKDIIFSMSCSFFPKFPNSVA